MINNQLGGTGASVGAMIESLRKHWREYLMEAAGLGGFIIGASLLTVLLEHPNLFVMESWLGSLPLLILLAN